MVDRLKKERLPEEQCYGLIHIYRSILLAAQTLKIELVHPALGRKYDVAVYIKRLLHDHRPTLLPNKVGSWKSLTYDEVLEIFEQLDTISKGESDFGIKLQRMGITKVLLYEAIEVINAGKHVRT